MPKDNYLLARVCYFITATFSAFACFANFRSGKTILAIIWLILCVVFLFASFKMKAAGKRAKEVGMVDNSKAARKAAKAAKAAELAAAAEVATEQIVDAKPADGDIASAVRASLYSSDSEKSALVEEAVVEDEPATTTEVSASEADPEEPVKPE